MNIRYIQSNISKIPQDNLIKFLYDIILQEIKNINTYQEGVEYYKGDKVYLQENGKHQIFQCIVDKSSSVFMDNEWVYIMETFEGEVNKIHTMQIKEEVHIINESNRNNIYTDLELSSSQSSVALYCGKKRYSKNNDFIIEGNNIIFNKPFNIGDRIILELRDNVGVTPIMISIVLYDLNGQSYDVYIDEKRIIGVKKKNIFNDNDVKYGELVTGDKTYTLLVDGGSEPYELKAYQKIETYITSTDDIIYKIVATENDFQLVESNRGDCFSDTKVILGLDRKFYTLSVSDGIVIANEYFDDNLDIRDFDLGVKVLTNKYTGRLISINEGKISLLPYTDNNGYRNINFVDKITGDIVRLNVTDDNLLEMYDGLDFDGESGTRLLNEFYFFDDEWYCNKMYVENGNLIFEDCELEETIPDSRGINLLKSDGELVNLKIPHMGEGIHIVKNINLNELGSFESPIEGFVVKVDNQTKLVTVNKDTNAFEIVDTNLPFRTNYHYVMSKDNRLYRLHVENDEVMFIENMVSVEGFVTYINAGDVYYHIDKNMTFIVLDFIPEPDEVGIVIVENEHGRYRLIENNGPMFVKTDEYYDNEIDSMINEDGKLCRFSMIDNDIYCECRDIEIIGEYDTERITTGSFIKSNEMITRFDIVDGQYVFNPISTFVHRIKSDNGKSYVIDVAGEPYNETIKLIDTNDIDFGKEVGYGNLYLEDTNGKYYVVNIDIKGNMKFKEMEPIDGVDYDITSIIDTSKGLYKIILEDMNIKLIKIFDNMFEYTLSYGNLVKKTLDMQGCDGLWYSLSVNGLGEVVINPIDKSVEVEGLLLKSDNGFNYGLAVENERFVTYKSFVTNSNVIDKLYLKDSVTGDNHVIFMKGDCLCSDISSKDVNNTSLIMLDAYQNKYKIEIENSILKVSSL